MNNNEQTIRALYNMLRRERELGFADSAVIGGLDGFLRNNAAALRPMLSGSTKLYADMTPSERSEWAGGVVARMRKALAEMPASAPPSAPPETASGERERPPASAQTQTPPPAREARRAPPKPKPKPPIPEQPMELSDPVSKMRGATSRILPRLKTLGIEKVGDLVYAFPSRHNDYGGIVPAAQLTPGDSRAALLTVWEASQTMLGNRKSTQAVLRDDTGTVRAVWFGNPNLSYVLKAGAEVVLSGKVNVFRGSLVFQAPEFEIIETEEDRARVGGLVPVYPATKGVTQPTLRSLIKRAVSACADKIEEHLPEDVRRRLGMMGVADAVRQMHYPDDWDAFRAARRRLAFDELLLLQMTVLQRRSEWKEEGAGVPLEVDAEKTDAFLNSLPFELTRAQTESLKDVLNDLESDRPMSRLLQGDVGSGKTVVAVAAMLAAVHNGKQAAMMAPTEILAEQHFLTVRGLLSPDFEPSPGFVQSLDVAGVGRKVRVALLIGSQRKRERDDLRAMLSAGMIDIAIGTHALIQEGVDIPNLALAVVDEQHRFGVSQRAALRDKGERPHVLAMSATPIPRSLALTVYGDLDVSVIDEMPPGRQPIRTRFVEGERRDAAYLFVREEIDAGRQAFVVCPLIDESEAVQTRAAQEEYARLSTEVYPDLNVGLLHGRMPLAEKDAVMGRFKSGELDILVSTPVIEVGIDVPNATVMLIDGAERFGLSQLHQFRGRVGRGAHQSHCLLMSDSPGAEAMNRLKLIERISDGFQLAEEDLKLRGPGDYLGTRQSGLPAFRVAQITDQDILTLARREAVRLLALDRDLSNPSHRGIAERFAEYSANLPGENS